MELREIFEKDFGAFEGLLNQSFPIVPGHSFIEDFPIWGKNGVHFYRVGLFASNHLIACGGIRFADATVDGNRFHVAMIGAIATSIDHRGKGHASRIIQALIDQGLQKTQKPEAYVLWGSEFDLYHRFGFELTGHQARIKLAEARLAPPAERFVMDRISAQDAFQIRLKNPDGLNLDAKDEAWYCAHRNTIFWGARESNRLIAYAAVGKGIDLPNMIHEWGGDPKGLKALFYGLKVDQPELQLLFHPLNHSQYLATAQGPIIRDHLCMARFESPQAKSLSSAFWFWGLDGV